MKKFLIFPMVLILLAVPVIVQAYIGLCCAKCGGNMPLNILGAGVPETKEFRIKAGLMLMNMDGLQNGTNAVSEDSLLGMPNMGKSMAVPTSMNMTMYNLAFGYSFTDDFFGGLMLMHKSNSMDMKFNSMMSMSTMMGGTGESGFTMKSEGVGDIMLMSKYRLYTDDPLFPTKQASFFFGLSLPTGSIDAKNSTHPMAMRQTEQLPYAMQLGSGTFDPTLGYVTSRSASPYWWGANIFYTPRFQKNSRDYSLGDEFKFDLYLMKQLRYDFLVQAQLNGSSLGKIKGEMDEAVTGVSGRATKNDPSSTYMSPLWNPENYGGEKLFATVGVQWQPYPMHVLDFTYGVPIYQNLNGPQLKESSRISITYYIEIPTSKSRRHGGNIPGPSGLGF